MMFVDLNQQTEYINHLEAIIEKTKSQNNQPDEIENVLVAAPVKVPDQSSQMVDQLKKELQELINVNEDLELRLEEKENKILELQDN